MPGMRQMRGATKKMSKHDIKTIKRLLSYFSIYKLRFIIVLICIVISAVAGVCGSMFIETLIDDYITPMLTGQISSYSSLINAILTMACIYVLGIIATFTYSRIMVYIAQGILKKIRDDMFTHMQSLPIKYFDTHNYGDVMSCYTNDTDTLRQMISMAIPQSFSSLITVVSVFFAMLYSSVYLTIFVLVMLVVMLYTVKFIGSTGRPTRISARSVSDFLI